MTMGKAVRWAGCATLGLCVSSRWLWRWASFALGVMAMIGVSESGRTFASLVTDPRGRIDIYAFTYQRPTTVRAGQATTNLALRELELLRSIELGEIAHVESLLAAGVSANIKDLQGWTPLMLAALHNRATLVPTLCAIGADPNAQNVKGTTALMLATNNGHGEMVRLLLDRGVKVNAQTTAGWTALMYAAWRGHTAIASELLRASADPTVIDSQRWSALMYAAWQGHAETVQVLLGSQRIHAMREGERKQARPLAISQGHAAIVHLLDQVAKRG